MAKISHDDSSWHASGVIKRDAQHTKDPEEDARMPGKKPARKKDTKRWCKGKEGRDHEIVWVAWETVYHYRSWTKIVTNRLVGRCKTCYKQMCSGVGAMKNGKTPMCQTHKVRHPAG
jgi:hypothetical protein